MSARLAAVPCLAGTAVTSRRAAVALGCLCVCRETAGPGAVIRNWFELDARP